MVVKVGRLRRAHLRLGQKMPALTYQGRAPSINARGVAYRRAFHHGKAKEWVCLVSAESYPFVGDKPSKELLRNICGRPPKRPLPLLSHYAF